MRKVTITYWPIPNTRSRKVSISKCSLKRKRQRDRDRNKQIYTYIYELKNSDYGRQSENSGFGNLLRNRKEIRAGLNSFLSAIDRTHSRCVISFPPAAAVSSASIASSRISHARAILIILSKPGNRWLLDHRYHLLKEQNKALPLCRALRFALPSTQLPSVSASRGRDVFCEIRLIWRKTHRNILFEMQNTRRKDTQCSKCKPSWR